MILKWHIYSLNSNFIQPPNRVQWEKFKKKNRFHGFDISRAIRRVTWLNGTRSIFLKLPPPKRIHWNAKLSNTKWLDEKKNGFDIKTFPEAPPPLSAVKRITDKGGQHVSRDSHEMRGKFMAGVCCVVTRTVLVFKDVVDGYDLSRKFNWIELDFNEFFGGGGVGKLMITRLILMKFGLCLYRWIALKLLYRKSFESNSIWLDCRVPIGRQSHVSRKVGERWRAFLNLFRTFPTDRFISSIYT